MLKNDAALKKIVNSGDPAEAFEVAQKLQAIPRMLILFVCTTVVN